MELHGFDASVSYVDSDQNLRDRHGRNVSGATILLQIGHAF